MYPKERGIEHLEISEKNYEKFLEYLEPKIEVISEFNGYRLQIEKSDLEELYRTCILSAIKSWNKKKSHGCKFETWYWKHTHRVEWTFVQSEWKERERIYRYYDYCYGSLNMYMYHKHKQEALEYSVDLTSILTRTEKIKEFEEILTYIRFMMGEGKTTAKAIGMSMKILAKKNNVSTAWMYQRLGNMRSFIKTLAKEANVHITSKEGGD